MLLIFKKHLTLLIVCFSYQVCLGQQLSKAEEQALYLSKLEQRIKVTQATVIIPILNRPDVLITQLKDHFSRYTDKIILIQVDTENQNLLVTHNGKLLDLEVYQILASYNILSGYQIRYDSFESNPLKSDLYEN
jgi:hypothetical protein